MTQETKRKAKRVLKNIDFSGEDAHIAFVGPAVGGPANLQDYALVMKSTANFSDEFIAKMQQVQVTYELPDFLEKVFGLYWDDAQILAAMLGYVKEEDEEYEIYDYRDWIEERLESFTILKSLKESDSIAGVMSTLSEEQYLTMLREQEMVEKAMSKYATEQEELAKAKDSEQPVVADKTKPKARIVKKKAEVLPEGHKADVSEAIVEKAVETNDAKTAVQAESKEVVKMTKTVEVEKTETVEMVEKAQFEEIMKAFEAQKEALQKAQESIAQFEKEKKEAIEKARKEAIEKAVGTEHAEAIAKAVLGADEEVFEAVVKALEAVAAKADESSLFVEKGVTSGEEVVPEDAESILKQRLRARLSGNK